MGCQGIKLRWEGRGEDSEGGGGIVKESKVGREGG